VANTQQTKIKASKRTFDATKHWNIIIKIIHARKPQEGSTKHKQAWINYPQWKKTHSKTEKLWEKKKPKRTKQTENAMTTTKWEISKTNRAQKFN
jgi:hypothetical protein